MALNILGVKEGVDPVLKERIDLNIEPVLFAYLKLSCSDQVRLDCIRIRKKIKKISS